MEAIREMHHGHPNGRGGGCRTTLVNDQCGDCGFQTGDEREDHDAYCPDDDVFMGFELFEMVCDETWSADSGNYETWLACPVKQQAENQKEDEDAEKTIQHEDKLSQDSPPQLPLIPRYSHGFFPESAMHDWDWRDGKFYFSTRATDQPTWALLEYDE